MYYLIDETLKESSLQQCLQSGKPCAAILTPQQWQQRRDEFDLGIDIDFDTLDIHTTMAEVNYDSITGSFMIPVHDANPVEYRKFAFALDEKGIVFIDSGHYAADIIARISQSRKWRLPSLERFIYDFLEEIIDKDLTVLENYEKQLAEQDELINSPQEAGLEKVNTIRDHLRILRTHYDRLVDLAQELEENENEFFAEENIRYFTLFGKRATRLSEMADSLLDYTSQIRDDYEARIAEKQNHIMTVLTVVTSIFMPLTLIAGWYGMNFKYMPELASIYGYPVIIILSVLIAVISLIYFRRKKWL